MDCLLGNQPSSPWFMSIQVSASLYLAIMIASSSALDIQGKIIDILPCSLMLCQIEGILVPIIDQNIHAYSCNGIKISKKYVALNDEIYISLEYQELRSCKHIGYNFH